MNNIFYLIKLCCLLSLLASCNKEINLSFYNPPANTTLQASTTDQPDLKNSNTSKKRKREDCEKTDYQKRDIEDDELNPVLAIDIIFPDEIVQEILYFFKQSCVPEDYKKFLPILAVNHQWHGCLIGLLNAQGGCMDKKELDFSELKNRGNIPRVFFSLVKRIGNLPTDIWPEVKNSGIRYMWFSNFDCFSQSDFEKFKDSIDFSNVETINFPNFPGEVYAHWMKELAEIKYKKGYYQLGRLYHIDLFPISGNKYELCKSKAIEWYTKAVEKYKDIAAANQLAHMCKEDNDEAGFLFWKTRAAELGDIAAANQLADICKEDNDEASFLLWKKKAAELGDIAAANQLADICKENNDEASFIFWKTRAAELGDKYAANQLADICKENNDEAGFLLWKKRAAHLGHKNAYYDIACYLQYVRGEPEQAIAWYKKAYKIHRNKKAAYQLADIYMDNNEESESDCWMEKAAGLGDLVDYYDLAEYYEDKGNTDKVKECYEIIYVKYKDKSAANDLAEIYKAKKDESKFIYWKEKAAEAGDVGAAQELAKRCKQNNDESKFIYWKEKAAEAGDVGAAQELAKRCKQNNDESKFIYWKEVAAKAKEKAEEEDYYYKEAWYYEYEENIDKAIEWYKKAFEVNKNRKAAFALARIYNQRGNKNEEDSWLQRSTEQEDYWIGKSTEQMG